MNGRTIRIYLVDGVPTGVLTAEIINWTGKVIVCPRSQLAELAKRDEARQFDLHAFRVQLASLLNRAGVAPRVAMLIMRHSDLRLTMRTYTDASIFNAQAAVSQLKLPGDKQADAPKAVNG
jgi:hypothetical protein